MRRQRCPYCAGLVDVLDSDLGKTVQCDKVRCGKFFLAMAVEPSAPTPVSPAPFDTTPKPRLTGPHRCLVCQGELATPLNRRRCTVLHRPQGGGDNCRMDVYAAVYQHLLRHRHAERLDVTSVLPVRTSVYDALGAARDLLPDTDDVRRVMDRVSARPEADVDREVADWFRV